MKAPLRSRVFITVVLLVAMASAAEARPIHNDDSGEWVDDYIDNFGVDVIGSVNVEHDFAGQLMRMTDPSAPGTLVTQPIPPASFSAWGAIDLRFSAADPNDIKVVAVGESGTRYEAPDLIMTPSPLSGWHGRVSLAAIPASEPSIHLEIELSSSFVAPGTLIAPTIQTVRVTWDPLAVVRIRYESPGSAPSNASQAWKVRTSVSLVEAKNLVVWAPLPVSGGNPFLQPDALIFEAAKQGGLFHPVGQAPILVDGVSIPGGSVYWRLGNRQAGTSFNLTYTVRSPQGTWNGTTYSGHAFAKPANGPLVVNGPTSLTISSAVSPFIKKSTGGTFELFGKHRVISGSPMTFSIEVGNFDFATSSTAGGQTYFNAVVYDEMAGWVNPGGEPYFKTPPGIHSISAGGQFHPGPAPLCVAATSPGCAGGVQVPANSIYWQLGNLGVGARRRLTFSLTVENTNIDSPPGPLVHDQSIFNTAHLESGAPNHPDPASSATVAIGVDNRPDGAYGVGEQFGFQFAITGGADDFYQRFINYGDSFTYLYAIANKGASAFVGNWIFTKVPSGTTFRSARSFFPGTTIYYSTAGAANDPSIPPGFDGGSGTLVSGPTWSSTLPPDPRDVEWVAYNVARVPGQYFPEPGMGNIAITSLGVVVDPPSDACAALLLQPRGLFYRFGVDPVGGGDDFIPDSGLQLDDLELTAVVPRTPYLGGITVDSIPTTAFGASFVTYRVTVPNRHPLNGDTDAAFNVRTRISMPSTQINGSDRFLPLISVVAPGASIDFAGLPAYIEVRWPAILPFDTRTIDVNMRVPRGLIDGSSLYLSANVSGFDDICPQPATGGASAFTTISAEPAFETFKSVDLSVFSQGSVLEYTIEFANTGDGVATQSWVVDRVPEGTSLVSASPPDAGGVVFFSSALPPELPDSVRDPDTSFDQNLILGSGLFAEGSPGPDGEILSPFGTATTYVAFQIDDPALSPPQLVTDELGQVSFRVQADNGLPPGSVVTNEASTGSRELLATVSNVAPGIVSGNPSLRVDRDCPGIIGNDEVVTWIVDYYNDSANNDDLVELEEIIPPDITFISAVHTWNGDAQGRLGGYTVPYQEVGDRVFVRPTNTPGGALRPLEGGTIVFTGRVSDTVPSGTLIELGGIGRSDNAQSPQVLSLFTACVALVENADLHLRKLVDRDDPLAGETLTYTLILQNAGVHDAFSVELRDLLPRRTSYVAGSMKSLTFDWAIGEPTVDLDTDELVWTSLKGPTGVPGYFPGRSGDVVLTFRATVDDDALPGARLDNCAEVTSPTPEDPDLPNAACAAARVPLPDPFVTKRAPLIAESRAEITYRIGYGNASRQAAGPIALVDTLPGGPAGVEVTFLGVNAPNGEEVWFSAAPIGAVQPLFDPAAPVAGGWVQDPALLPVVNHIAFVPDAPLGGSEGPFAVFVDVAIEDPQGGTPEPGTELTNTVSVRMTEPVAADGNTDNNVAYAITATPGVDIAVVKRCIPEGADPGLRPGEVLTFEIELENSGTVPAYGLSLTDTLGPGLTFLGDDAVTVQAFDRQGLPSQLIDLSETPLRDDIAFTREGDTLVLGNRDAAAGNTSYYRRVGLKSRDHVLVRMTALVGDVANKAPVTNSVTVLTDYREGHQAPPDAVEEDFSNNTDSCSTTIYRADVAVTKSVAKVAGLVAPGVAVGALQVAGPSGSVGAGERVRFTVTFDNRGGGEADEVELEDLMPAGGAFVVGTLRGVPEEVGVRYDDGDDAFDYPPVGADGTPDPAVRALRLEWETALKAPPNSTFSQSSGLHFAEGIFDGAAVVGEQVVMGGDAPTGEFPSYTTPVFPSESEGNVVEWGRLVVRTSGEDADEPTIVYTVIDAATNDPVTGFERLEPDSSGAIDLTGLDPAAHPRIRIRAEIVKFGVECDPRNVLSSTLKSGTPYQDRGYVQHAALNGALAGNLGNGLLQRAVGWLPTAGGYQAHALDQLGPSEAHPFDFDEQDGSFSIFVLHGSEYERGIFDAESNMGAMFTPHGGGYLQQLLGPTGFQVDHVEKNAFIKEIRGDLAVGEWRDTAEDEDALPIPLLLKKDANGVWQEIILPPQATTPNASLRFIGSDGTLFAECETTVGQFQFEQQRVCIWDRTGPNTWVPAFAAPFDPSDSAGQQELAGIFSHDVALFEASVSFSGQANVVYRDGGTWTTAPLLEGGQPLLIDAGRKIVIGPDHFITRDPAPIFLMRKGGAAPHGVEVVPVPDVQLRNVFMANAAGVLVGVLENARGFIWPRNTNGSYQSADRIDAAPDHPYSEVYAINSFGVAFGYAGEFPSDCAPNGDLDPVKPRCTCELGCEPLTGTQFGHLYQCVPDPGGGGSTACLTPQGFAWVPATANEGWRMVRLEGSRPTLDEDAYFDEDVGDAQYPQFVAENGLIFGMIDRPYEPRNDESDGDDECGNSVPIYWDPVLEPVSAPKKDLPTPEVHVAQIRGANSRGVFAGTSFDSRNAWHPTIWEPGVTGWTPKLLPEPGASILGEGRELRGAEANDVAEDGRVVGAYEDDQDNLELVWLPDGNGGYTIAPLPEYGYSLNHEFLPNGLIAGSDEDTWDYYEPEDRQWHREVYWAPTGPTTYALVQNGGNIGVFNGHSPDGTLFGYYPDSTFEPTLWRADPSQPEGLLAVTLEGVGAVLDMNADDLAVGRITVGGVTRAAVWVPSGVGSWTLSDTLGVGEAEHVDESGLIGGIRGGHAILWEETGTNVWTERPLPHAADARNSRLRPERWLFDQGYYIAEADNVVWEKRNGTWTAIELLDPLGQKPHVLLGIPDAAGGKIYAGNQLAPFKRLLVWRADAGGNYVVFDVTPQGFAQGAIQMLWPAARADGLAFTAHAGDGNYEGTNDIGDTDSYKWARRYLFFGDETAESGVTSRLMPLHFGNPSRLEMTPSTDVPGMWFGDAYGRGVEAMIWGCLFASAGALDAIRAVYRTDRAPQLSFEMEVLDVCQTELTNNVSISTTTVEITEANNDADATIAVENADLAVTITPDRGVAAIGDLISWTIAVTNQGTYTARSFDLDFDVPNGVIAGTMAIDDGRDLAPGETATSTVSGTVTTSVIGLPLVAIAAVDSPTIDCNAGNDAASATTVNGNFANLFALAEAPDGVRVGEPFTVTFTYGNNGNVNATDVELAVTLPPGADTWPTPSPSPLIFTPPGGGLLAGASATAEIELIIGDCDAIGDSFRFDGVVSSTTPDVNGADDRAAAEVRVSGAPADVTLTLAPDRATAEPGDVVTWTLLIDNAGPANATDLNVGVQIADGHSAIPGSITARGTPVANAISWDIALVPPGGHAAVAFATLVNPATPIDTPVSVSARTIGGGTCEALAGALALVTGPRVHAVKVADTRFACDGEVSWSIVLTNTSGVAVPGVVVSDDLGDLTLVAGSMSGPGADAGAAPVLVWDVGTVPAKGAVSLGYRTLGPSGRALISNRAEVSFAGQIWPTSPTYLWVDCDQALSLQKSFGSHCATAGDGLRIELAVHNRGNLAATGVVVRDWIAPGLTLTDAGGGSYDAGSGAITFPLGTIGGGLSAAVAFEVETGAPAEVGDLVLDQASLGGDENQTLVSNGVAGVVRDCDDGDPCTADGCAAGATLACAHGPAPDGTSCDDDDACTAVDTCQTGICTGADRNTCPAPDVCHVTGTCDALSGQCSYPNAPPGTSCDDGSQCTTVDTCVAGECTGSTPLGCDDGDPCNVDGCSDETGCTHVAGNDGATCDDDDNCTTASECAAGTCVGTTAKVCDDGDDCTFDTCDRVTGCIFPTLPDGSGCDDEDACSQVDQCQNGTCTGGFFIVCTASDQCHDAGTCNTTTGACNDPAKVNSTPCDDDNACTTGEACQSGVCTGGTAASCDDSNPCTTDSCTAAGCTHVAGNAGGNCDDDDACTTASQCSAGVCVGTAQRVCTDSLACTTDSCDPATGCVFPNAPNGTGCNDGNACTQVDQCQGGACQGTFPVVCAPIDVCHIAGICNAATGSCSAVNAATGTSCNDGNACTTIDSCLAGACIGSGAISCDDGEPCTSDRCDAATGCVRTPVPDGRVCDDDNACSLASECQGGRCAALNSVKCDDGDVCTSDSCDVELGCVTTPVANGSPCDDGSECTTDDRCQAGACVGDVPLACDDGEECTADGCDDELGCTRTPVLDGTACDDDNLCSATSECREGRCAAVDGVVCNDGNDCTADTCDADLGCRASPVANGTPCDDGDGCTVGDDCSAGICGGDQRACPEEGVCFEAGVCNSTTGACEYAVKPGDVPLPIGLTDLGALGGDESAALALDAAGRVVGWAGNAAGRRHAFLWDAGAMTDLTPGAGVTDAVALSIGSGGHVAGALSDASGATAFRWRNGTTERLWTIGAVDTARVLGPSAAGHVAGDGLGAGGVATDFHAAPGAVAAIVEAPAGGSAVKLRALYDGVVVGTVEIGGETRAFRWSGPGTGSDIGQSESRANDVNAAGDAVGIASGRATLWRSAGAVIDIGLVCDGACGTTSEALFVNDGGVVLGQGDTAGGDVHAFLWTEATGLLDLSVLSGGDSAALALSAAGMAVGTSTTSWGATHAVRWDVSGALTDLGVFGASASVPVAVNDRGQVAGNLITLAGRSRAFFYEDTRGLVDLGTLGGGEAHAVAMNASGRVVGSADVADGTSRGFLSAVPATGCLVCETDEVPPQIACAIFKGSVECIDGGADVELGPPSVFDACARPVTVTDDAPERYPLGATEVTFTATDEAGNQASCGRTIVVVDTQPPAIVCPAAQTVATPDGVCGAPAAFAVTVSDGCDDEEQLTVIAPAADLLFPVGTTSVELAVLDRAGNRASCETSVTVVDAEGIAIDCEPELLLDAPADECGFPDAVTAVASGACLGDVGLESDADRFPIGDTTVTFAVDVPDREPVTCQTLVTVRDVTAPTVACNLPPALGPNDLPLLVQPEVVDACGAVVTYEDVTCTGAEGCRLEVANDALVIADLPSGELAIGFTVVATDAAGNAGEAVCITSVSIPVPPVEPEPVDDQFIASGDGGCRAGDGALVGLAIFGVMLFAARRRRGARG